MKQKCVATTSAVEFQEECNKLLAAGWEVIPGTTASSVSSAYDETWERMDVNKTFVAFFKYTEPNRTTY